MKTINSENTEHRTQNTEHRTQSLVSDTPGWLLLPKSVLVPQFTAEITVVLTIVGVIIVPHHNDPITMRRHNKTSNLPHQNNGDHGHNEGDRNIAIVA